MFAMSADPFVYDPPLNPFLDILYEDSCLMVVHKPSGLLSVPGRLRQYHDSVLSRVRTLYPQAQAVHRLDLGTSGILVVGLNPQGISALGQQFMQRRTQKEYVAEVAGKLSEGGTISLPLRTDLENRPYQIVDFKLGREAITDYRPLAYDPRTDTSLVFLLPHTGRSHQLRIHLKEIGHPILGDHLYAPPDVFAAAPRLNLHAQYLRFFHPLSGQAMEFGCSSAFIEDFYRRGQELAATTLEQTATTAC